MWRVRPREQSPVAATPSPVPSNLLGTVTSVGRPYTTLTVGAVPGRGFVFSMTDALARDITSPTIPNESIARALEGGPVVYRHGGYVVEMTPFEDTIRIRCYRPGTPAVEGAFLADDLERAMRTHGAKDGVSVRI